jgi:hypothetical protein
MTKQIYIHNCGIAQSVWRLATGWTVRGSNSEEGEIFRTLPEPTSEVQPALCNGPFQEVYLPGVASITHLYLAAGLMKE